MRGSPEATCTLHVSVGLQPVTVYIDFLAVPPSAPTIEGAVATSSTTIAVQWAASADDGGSPLVSYIIEYRLSHETEFSDITVSMETLSTTISGLTPFGQYEVRVRGENAVGPGDPSASLIAQTHPDGG